MIAINKLVLAILGPTASGKTSVAIEIAKKNNGVIINCDSRQIYKEMLIGTASPSDEEKEEVPHKLFNFLSPQLQFNASDYAKAASEAIKETWAESKLPILVGGTGFYYSAISEGLGEAGSDSDLANQLQRELDQKGLSYMVEKLGKLDSEATNTIDVNNSRRVLRAIEIVISTGKPFSENKPVSLLPEAVFHPVVVSRTRELLHERIALRVKQMFEEGLENEVKHIIEKYGINAAAISSIGYREWLEFFEGKINLDEVKELILIHTRQYAKRQETWFRKKPGVPIIYLDDINEKDVISQI